VRAYASVPLQKKIHGMTYSELMADLLGGLPSTPSWLEVLAGKCYTGLTVKYKNLTEMFILCMHDLEATVVLVIVFLIYI